MLNLKAIISNTISDDFPEEHIARLKKHNIQSFWIHMVLAFTLLVSLVSANTENTRALIIWLGVLTITGFVRLSHNSTQTIPSNIDPFSSKLWVSKYILLTTFMSALWGAAGIFLLSQEPVIQTTLLILLISVLISTIPLLLASKSAFFAQFISILAPLTFSLSFNFSVKEHLMLSACLIALAVTIIFASSYLNQIITQLQEAQRALQTQADTDQLTKLANRRAFDTSFKKEWRRSTRDQNAISLLIIDVDDFKLYNDTLGHFAGDECLKKIAQATQDNALRPSDIAARIGGEEFAILLPETDTEGAFRVAERLQQSVKRLDVKHPTDKSRNLTVSIGISSCTPAPLSDDQQSDVIFPAMLIKSADYAMYQAKRDGKNTIVTEGCGMHSVPPSLKEPEAKIQAEVLPV
ncbi:MAG: GGDEF domain-containing protein [Thiotrichaceae bacterium]